MYELILQTSTLFSVENFTLSVPSSPISQTRLSMHHYEARFVVFGFVMSIVL